MLLLADSGSTTTSWTLVKDSEIILQFESEGYNPCYNSSEEIRSSLSKSLPEELNSNNISLVAFYGAGCREDKHNIIIDALLPLFPSSRFDIASDLMASARALLGRQPGFVAILGTGSNSCLYDGSKITRNIPPLGFLLGDEGSGSHMGKRIISDYARNRMPPDIRDMFYSKYRLDPSQLIARVYSSAMPNRYCASFTKFLSDEQLINHDYITSVKSDSFADFFKNVVTSYPNYSDYLFNSVGSIGWIFKDTLISVASRFGMKTGKIIQSPMENLITYHQT